MSALPVRLIQSRDVKGAALACVLRGGTNRVIWNSCRLIWDSLDLIEDSPAQDNQMAVFGVRGKVESQLHKQLDFQVRYTINFDNKPKYRLHVAVTGPTGENFEEEHKETDIVQSNLLEENEQRTSFREAIYALTQQTQSMGVEATIRSFMELKGIASDMANEDGLPTIPRGSDGVL